MKKSAFWGQMVRTHHLTPKCGSFPRQFLESHPKVFQPQYNRTYMLRRLFLLIFLIIAFTLAVAQAPLYTSNQNQYFLHGMAQAGVGSLATDWLAGTLDPTPVFSFLIFAVCSFTRWKEIFYLFYALLAGIYLFSLLGILEHVFHLRASHGRFLFAAAALTAIHSAALRFVLVRSLGNNWAYLFDGGLAGQRLLGNVFQPSAFGVFLLLSLYLFLKGRRAWAVLSAVLAATVHPTYLLAAGLFTAGYLIVSAFQERRWKQAAWMAILALLTIAPVLGYVYGNFGLAVQPGDAQTASEARRILVQFRIPHHAQVSTWFDLTSVIKLFLIAAALVVIRKQRPLFTILLTVSLASAALSLLQIQTDNSALALLFPWRPSVLLVPLSTAILIGLLADVRLDSLTWLPKASTAAILLLGLAGGFYTSHDMRQKNSAPDQPMLDWVVKNSRNSDVYMIPIKMENFRLETSRPVYVDFMSIPYAAPDVLVWYYRVLSTARFYADPPCEEVVNFVYDGAITHIIRESNPPFNCQYLTPVYVDEDYTVYKVEYQSSD